MRAWQGGGEGRTIILPSKPADNFRLLLVAHHLPTTRVHWGPGELNLLSNATKLQVLPSRFWFSNKNSKVPISFSLHSPLWYWVPVHPSVQTNLEKEMDSQAYDCLCNNSSACRAWHLPFSDGQDTCWLASHLRVLLCPLTGGRRCLERARKVMIIAWGRRG